MITDALMAIIQGVFVHFVNHWIPSLDVSGFTTSLTTTVPQVLGSWFGLIDPFVPTIEILGFVMVWIGVLGVIGVMAIFNFVYNHIPTIAGFGTR